VNDAVEVLFTGVNAPTIAHPGDAGADLSTTDSVTLPPGGRATVGTGLAIALPDGFVAFVVPRSGLAAKHGISIVNSPGTVDAAYRGEIRVTLINLDPHESFTVNPGDRIAQLIVMPLVRPRFVAVESLPGTHRAEGGFGSSGISS
jgi:dUTP pyrophosphatase